MKYDLEEILKNTLQEKRQMRLPGKSAGLEELVTGEFLDAEQQVFLSENVYPLPVVVGNILLEKRDIAEVIAEWSGAPAGLGSDDLLFLDTETTGLSGGTGTWVFMTGLGYFEGENFVIRQYFLQDLGSENKFMQYIEQELQKRQALVTFNGKSYDVNLLKTRFIMNGMKVEQLEKPNIDLLFLGRRLWKSFLENCRLQTMEQEILGIRRKGEDDLPSSEIPERYFEFLETGDAFYMEKVFWHNRQDILSMPALLQHVSECFVKIDFTEAKAGSALGIARLLAEQGKTAEAEKCLRSGENGDEAEMCRYHLALLYKRQGNYEAARAIWLQEENKTVQVLEELAKHSEHKLKDLHQALQWTEHALQQLLAADFVDGRAMANWQQRKQRLLTKKKRYEQRKAATEH
ncbi:MAG: ribonuclease H-like domain-containing protein [Candidatus Cloacimonetes bacterium]|nr:ribonuclease H-like domain-containing protein [Candidatus Cloacimonadota bacterium]